MIKHLCRFILRVLNLSGWIIDSFRWKTYRAFPSLKGRIKSDKRITIGITTFLNRFEQFFKPLINKLMFLLPGSRIIVMANGSVLKEEQREYLLRLKDFCSHFANIELMVYEEPRGLSHLWNRIMRQAGSDSVLMLNDDIRLKTNFGKFIDRSGILKEEIATVNSSWSHFMISQKIFRLVGEFDEELREVGGEDDDYLARLALLGLRPVDYRSHAIARGRRKKKKNNPDLNSYGKDMTKEAYGYSSYNTDYLRNKWEISDDYFEGAVEVPRTRNRYWKLKESSSQVKAADD